MKPTTPMSAMSQGGTFMRPGAMAWGRGEGLVISVTLDDPASGTAHREVLDAVEGAVLTAPGEGFPIDVTFPGEGEPDLLDTWISAHAEPFYIRP
jgi:hypothetical protein